MANKKVLNNATIVLGGVDISGNANEFSMTPSTEVRDTTNFASSGVREFGAALKSFDCSITGMFEVADDPHETIRGATSFPIWVTHSNSAAKGDLAYLAEAVIRETWNLRHPIGDVHSFTYSGKNEGIHGYGRVLANGSGLTSSGTGGTGYQLGTVSASQTLLLIQAVFSGTSGTFDNLVESDTADTFGTATTRGTFAQVAAASTPTYEVIKVSGAISDDYFRDNYTIAGGTWAYGLAAAII